MGTRRSLRRNPKRIKYSVGYAFDQDNDIRERLHNVEHELLTLRQDLAGRAIESEAVRQAVGECEVNDISALLRLFLLNSFHSLRLKKYKDILLLSGESTIVQEKLVTRSFYCTQKAFTDFAKLKGSDNGSDIVPCAIEGQPGGLQVDLLSFSNICDVLGIPDSLAPGMLVLLITETSKVSPTF